MVKKQKSLLLLFLFVSLFSSVSHTEEEVDKRYSIHFNDISFIEFLRFVSKISKTNFIFDKKDLEFYVTVAFANPMSSEDVLRSFIQMLRMRGFSVLQEDGYYVVHKIGENDSLNSSSDGVSGPRGSSFSGISDKLEKYEFATYKLQYHPGDRIQEALKKVAVDLRRQPDPPGKILNAIETLQWVQATNSLLFSGDVETVVNLRKLIDSLDVPLRQVFIEVLVIETDVRKGVDFGLQWGAGGQLGGKLGFGTAGVSPNASPTFMQNLQGTSPAAPPTGFNQIPVGGGFDLGVIGDLILHKGTSYLSLGALVSALQMDSDTTIVLNQKLITQDNKNSKIFVGDNIPFTGSVVQTVGSNQQTTANIEYRDVGVSLSITPMLGEGDVITLDINEEISESVTNLNAPQSATVNGIHTTKTNMVTHVHVPDKHFLVLSGMIRNSKMRHKSGIPCLGGLPYIGAAFSNTKKRDEKRNVIIFVRPQIIHSVADYQKITQIQPGSEQVQEKFP